MLFYAFYPVDLASHSSALTPYETSCINQFHLASYVGLDSLACQVLDAFHIWPSQSLRFVDSWSWTNSIFLKRKSLYHWVISNLLRCADSVASYSFGIQNTTHHVPFVLRTTQSSFAICVGSRLSRTSTYHSNCIRALGCNPSDKYTTLSHTN
jgi:hypothetical protein